MITWDRKQGIEWVLFGFLAHRIVFLRSNDHDDVYVGMNFVHGFRLRVLDREGDRSEFIILEALIVINILTYEVMSEVSDLFIPNE